MLHRRHAAGYRLWTDHPPPSARVRAVRLAAWSLFDPGADGVVTGFDPLAAGVARKHLKTMTRAVQLGVAGVHAALAHVSLADFAPERRGLFVGASPQSGDAEDLEAAVSASQRSLAGFVAHGIPLIPPLWLVKGLSNNILGYASAQHDLRGDNGNWCDGRLSGAIALCNAVAAVREGRVDLAIAGGADALVGAESVVGGRCAEGAAFFVFVAGEGSGWRAEAGIPSEVGACTDAGEMGAVSVPVGLGRALRASEGSLVAVGGVRLTRSGAS